jgi:phytoene dehydrogenase-like protein
MGGLTQAIAAAARHSGVEIRTSATVERILVKCGRAAGVVLAGGEDVRASTVISNADPRTTFLKLLDPQQLNPEFLRHAGNIKYRGCGARVHLALAELPRFAALNDAGPAAPFAGPIVIAPGVDYLEMAHDDAKYGTFSRRPMLEARLPSLLDPSLAPPGKHTLSVYVQYAPYHLRHGDWEAARQPLGDAVVDTLCDYAPNLRGAILARKVLTPLDFETCYGLPEGNGNHGEMTLDQFLHMRPVPGWAQYQTPIAGLYLCGAGTHPGGGVTGANGHNAARVILKGR